MNITNQDINRNMVLHAVIKKDFLYTGTIQSENIATGTYIIELWGAQGGHVVGNETAVGTGGYGAYTFGIVSFSSNQVLHFYIGEQGISNTFSTNQGDLVKTAFNGGGGSIRGGGGGGATDVRLVPGAWDNPIGLSSRIMIAGGGGGTSHHESNDRLIAQSQGSHGGGLEGLKSVQSLLSGFGGTQTEGGSKGSGGTQPTDAFDGKFGVGADAWVYDSWHGACGSGGGGGYYGGGSGQYCSGCYPGSGGSGSSFISGHTGSVAITSATDLTPKNGCDNGTTDYNCSIHYSHIIFTNTVMIDGAGYEWSHVRNDLTFMPNPLGGNYDSNTGHVGNGYARITRID